MKKCICLLLFAVAAMPAAELKGSGSPRVFIDTLPVSIKDNQFDFANYLAAAIIKKKVPVVVTHNRDEATYFLTSAVEQKDSSTTSKVLGCLFAYCAGTMGHQTAAVQLIRADNKEVAYAYEVRKGAYWAYQSSAEAIAKHLKQFLEQHPQ